MPPDFEDAVQDQTALKNDIAAIINRNMKDFINAVTKVVSSEDFLAIRGEVFTDLIKEYGETPSAY